MNKHNLTPGTQVLATKIAEILALCDDLGLSGVGISLNSALVQLTGEGVAPVGFDAR